MRRCLLAFALSVAPAFAVCTATVTNPGSASVKSGLINLTATVANCPPGSRAYYQFDDAPATNEPPVNGPLFTEYGFNTGKLWDGPYNVRIIVLDATGAVAVTSADVAFSINNNGLVITGETCSSTASGSVTCNAVPTVGGTLSLSYSTTHTPASDLQNIYWVVDGEKLQSNGTTNPPYSLSYDTTKLPNGKHFFSSFLQCIPSATCGAVNGAGTGGDLSRFFVGHVFNVQNGTVLRGVQPSLEHITTTVGGTVTLDATLAQTDGTTTNGTFNLTMEHACIGMVRSQQGLGFPCVSGLSSPTAFAGAEGAPYVSLSAATLTSGAPITITGLALGETYLTITDAGSGKSQVVPIIVTSTLAVSHFGSCGSIYSSYTGGTCPSIFRSSFFNMTAVGDPSMWTQIPRVGLTAFEDSGWWRDPDNGGSSLDPNFSFWQSQWQANQLTAITNAMTAMPKVCYVMRSDDITVTPWGPLTQIQLGANALGGTNWLTNPFPYALNTLQATKKICGHEPRDEMDQGLGFNDNYSMKFSDGSLGKMVCKNGVCLPYPGNGNYPATDFYGANSRLPPNPTRIRNATTAGLNGQHNTGCYYHSAYNTYFATLHNITAVTNANPVRVTVSGNFSSPDMTANQAIRIYGLTGAWVPLNGTWFPASLSLPGNTFTVPVDGTSLGPLSGSGIAYAAGCADPLTNTEVLDSWTFPAAVADGTYTAATDPNLEILGWGDKTGYPNTGSLPVPNNLIQFFVAGFKTAGIKSSAPLLGNTDIIAALTYQTSAMTDYHTKLEFNGLQFYPWGQAFNEYYWLNFGQKWGYYGNYADPQNRSTGGWWQKEGTGYLSAPQDVPQVTQINISAPAFQMGGVQTNITSMSGSTMTTAAPHGIPQPGGAPGVSDYAKLTVAGNSDSAMNGHWYAYPLSSNTLEIFGSTNGASSCVWSSGPSGTATVRGKSYTLQANFGSAYGQVKSISGDFPHDLLPGELVTGAGGPGCWNKTWAFRGWISAGNGVASPPNYANMSVAALANSTGTGGTELANWGQGEANPLYDYVNDVPRKEACSAQVLYAAGHGWAGIRAYAGANLWSALSSWKSFWPNDGSQVQTNPLPFSNANLSFQQRWDQCAPGLNLANRLTPFLVGNRAPTPWISPGPPWVSATLTKSTAGNLLTVTNFSEMPVTVSVPLGTYCQIISNPISVYEIDGVHSSTNLLTGAQTNYSLTMAPGEHDDFACHAGASSFVQPVPLSFSAPTGTATTALQAIYGNYSDPLAQYTRPAVTSSSSPLTANLDPSLTDIWLQRAYVDSSTNLIGRSAFELVPFQVAAVISGAPVVNTTSPLPSGLANIAYTTTLKAAGNTPITWSVTAGALPPGLALNASTGVISGTPTTLGTFSFTATATNAVGSGSKAFTLAIGGTPPTITTATPLPAGTINVAYTTTIAATGTTPFTWSVSVGTLPTGLSLNASTGVVSGTPTIAGTSNFTVRATSAAGSGVKAFTLTINGIAPVITSKPPLPSGTLSVAYTTTLTATGSTPITWALVSGSLPTGLSLNTSTGVISGTPSATGTSAFRVSATNGAGSNQKNLNITINGVPPTITTATPLPQATQGTAYTTTVASTGTTPITYSLASGTLPTGLTLHSGTGVIDGTPTGTGTSSFTILATNGAGTFAKAFSLTVIPTPVAPTITSTSPLPQGNQNVFYSVALLATGTTPITWSVTVGSLPTGLSLDANSGLISGTPTVVATSSFTVQASNVAGTNSVAFSLTIVVGSGTTIAGNAVVAGSVVIH